MRVDYHNHSQILNYMKKCYLNWNKDTVEDAVIFGHLFELSGGKIDLASKDEELSDASNLLKSKKKFSILKKIEVCMLTYLTRCALHTFFYLKHIL